MKMLRTFGPICMLVLTAHAGVYDDCAAWWHFDYDANSNGLSEADEIRDQRDWGTAATKGTNGKHATQTYGLLGSPRWTNSAAFRPAGGREYGGRSMYFQPSIDPVTTTNVWPDTFRVSNLGLAGSATLLTRLRWDGYPTPLEKMSWLYNNYMEWNAYRGWLFGIQSNAYPQLTLYTQRATVTMDVPMTNGLWYDVAIVLSDGGTTNPNDTVEFYLWPQAGALAYQKKTTTVITNSIGTGGTVVGCETYTTAYAPSNARKAFTGALNHLAVWNRALSYAEVMEAFGYPQPRFQIGLKNNSMSDLRPESETDAEFLPGDPWHTMRRAVSGTYRDATLKIPMTNYQARLNYAFHVATLTDGNEANLSLIVNSTTNEIKAAGQGKDLFWYVTTNQLVTGTNAFTLHYESGTSAYAGFDWMELGGAWQIGYEDNNQAEFSTESAAPDDFYVTDPNWMHLERAIVSAETNTQLRFVLSAELAKKYFFTYTTRVINQGYGITNHAFSVDFNSTPLASFPPQTNGTYITLPIDRKLVVPGENVIRLRYDDSPSIAGYLQFDFHRITVKPPPKGTLFYSR